jgi:hypothetical protein
VARIPRLSDSWWGFIGAALVIAVLITFGIAYSVGGETSMVLESGVGNRELGALRIGETRAQTEAALGPGQDALEYGQTGPAVEPVDAECTYYTPESGFLTAVVQLCYRDGRLASRRRYKLPFAQELAGPAG